MGRCCVVGFGNTKCLPALAATIFCAYRKQHVGGMQRFFVFRELLLDFAPLKEDGTHGTPDSDVGGFPCDFMRAFWFSRFRHQRLACRHL